MTAIDDIKARLDIVSVVSETVKLRRTGKNYIGFCPFHPNTRTPAFVVNPERGYWRCYGQCNEGGDIFRFVMKKEGWDFPEALRHLAEKAGVVLEAPTPERIEREETHDRLRNLMEEAVTFYRHHLSTPAGAAARAFLNKRGLTAETIEVFGLGYAPDSYEAARQHFTGRGYSPDDLLAAGLASERNDGSGVYDRFRNRIMFPIRDMAGRMCGFGARVLNPNDVPKFLNSPQTVLFDKGRLLYGLDQARKTIRSEDQVVIVEGYLDVIVLHQGGFTNTVSPMGTALTEDQLRTLKRFTRRIVLALDADAAGQKATLRGLEVARQALDQSGELAFDARGLLHSEARLQADLRVTTIPEGMDPDEVVLRNPEEWREILNAARPIVVHVMETLAADRDLDDAKAKSEVAAAVLPLIEDIPNPIEREDYRQRLARLLRVDERALVGSGRVARPRREPFGRPAGTQPAQPPAAVNIAPAVARGLAMEAHCLKIMLRQPEMLYSVDRSLQQADLKRVDLPDFEKFEYQALFKLVQQSLEQDEGEPEDYIQAHRPEALAETLAVLLQPPAYSERNEDALKEDLFRTIVQLRLLRAGEALEQIRRLREDAATDEEDAQSEPLDMYNEITFQLTATRRGLEKALVRTIKID